MLSIWWRRHKVMGLIVFNKQSVTCSAIDIFCMEKLKPRKTDTAVFCQKLTETEPETKIKKP